MKNYLLLLLFFCLALSIYAQKQDIILKTDATLIRAYHAQVRDREVTYQLKPQKNAPSFTLNTDEIIKIEFADGRSYYFQIPPIVVPKLRPTTAIKQVPKIKPNPSKRSGVKLPDLILTREKRVIECEIIAINGREIKYIVITDFRKTVRTIKRKEVLAHEKNLSAQEMPLVVQKLPAREIPKPSKAFYRYGSATFYAEGAYISPALSPQWATDRIGLGLRQGVGGAFLYHRRLAKWVGLCVGTGYLQWETERQYKENNVVVYSSTDKLQRIPLQAGVRLYLLPNVYVMPQANAQWVALTGTTSENHLIPSINSTQNTFYFGWNANVGMEWRGKRVLVDLGVGFSRLPKKTNELIWFYALTNRLNFFSVRAGIGFVKYRKTK